MGRKIQDLTGQRFGKLIALREDGRNNGNVLWCCKCDCGNYHSTRASNLKRGRTKTCGGCLADTHSRHPLYKTWKEMRQRCKNKNSKVYKHYGGRGITICNRWHDFNNFRDDMASTYKKGLSIDRIDNNGNYEPSNCRWSTPKEQARNKRNNIYVRYKGQHRLLIELSEICCVNFNVLKGRIDLGWDIEKTLNTPVRPKKPRKKKSNEQLSLFE